MSDSIAQQLVNYMNSRMPRPEQVQAAIHAPLSEIGEAGAAFRQGGHDALLGALRILANSPAPKRAMLPVNTAPIAPSGEPERYSPTLIHIGSRG